MGRRRPIIAFFIIMLAYFAVRYFRSTYPGLPKFVHFYLTDFLFVPAMASAGLIFVRLLKRDHALLISPVLLLFQTGLISCYFEWYLPNSVQNNVRYTGDLIDVLIYFLGAVFYYILQQSTFKSLSR